MKTAEILELRSAAAAIDELAEPLANVDGALALSMQFEEHVRIVLLGRIGTIPEALERLYDIAPR